MIIIMTHSNEYNIQCTIYNIQYYITSTTHRTIDQLKSRLGDVEHERGKSQNELSNLRK